jgi:hypothetical protein
VLHHEQTERAERDADPEDERDQVRLKEDLALQKEARERRQKTDGTHHRRLRTHRVDGFNRPHVQRGVIKMSAHSCPPPAL